MDLPPPNPTACTCPAGNNCRWRLQPPQLSWGLIAAPLSPPQPSPGPHCSSWHPGGAPPLRFSEAAARIQLWGWGHARSPSPGAACGGGGGGDDHGSQCAGGCRPCPQMSPRPQGAAELNAARAAAPASPRAGLAWAAALLGRGENRGGNTAVGTRTCHTYAPSFAPKPCCPPPPSTGAISRTCARQLHAMPPPAAHPSCPHASGGPPTRGCAAPRAQLGDEVALEVLPPAPGTPQQFGGDPTAIGSPPHRPPTPSKKKKKKSETRAGWVFHSLFRILFYLLQTYNSLNIDCKTPFAKICYGKECSLA